MSDITDFYDGPMQRVTHEAMRGPSGWSVGDRELMAAFVANTNESEWCTKAHAATAKERTRSTCSRAATTDHDEFN